MTMALRVIRVGLWVGLVIALMPILGTIGAALVAEAAGCTLHEGFVNPCVIFGVDWGTHLYQAFVMGMLSVLTLPFAAIFAGFLLLMGIVRVLRWLWR